MTLLMAHGGRPGKKEAEPVLVELIGSRAILRLDDGDKLEFDLIALLEVLDSKLAAADVTTGAFYETDRPHARGGRQGM